MDGDVCAHEVVLDGEITGSIVAERVEIQPSAVMHGDITASTMMIHDGAVLDVNLVLQSHVAQPKIAGRAQGQRVLTLTT